MDSLPTPGKPIIVSDVTNDCPSISWPVQGDVTPITHYTVFWGRTDDELDTPSCWESVDTNTTQQEYAFDNLKLGTCYQFKVASNIRNRQSKSSQPSDVIRIGKDLEMPSRVDTCAHKSMPSQSSTIETEYKTTQSGSDSLERGANREARSGVSKSIADRINNCVIPNAFKPENLGLTPHPTTAKRNQFEVHPMVSSQPNVPKNTNMPGLALLANLISRTPKPDNIQQEGAKSPRGISRKGCEQIVTTANEPAKEKLSTHPTCTPPVPVPLASVLTPGRINRDDKKIFTTANEPEREKPFKNTRPVWPPQPIPPPPASAPTPSRIGQDGNKKRRAPPIPTPHVFAQNPGRDSTHEQEHMSFKEISKLIESCDRFADGRTKGKTFREQLAKQSKLAKTDKDIHVPVYQVQLKSVRRNETDRIEIFEFGNEPKVHVDERVILLVGATGAGKTTLINGLFNYLLGVEWEETVRFRLVEETGLFETQHKSQTRAVIVYKIYHNPVYSVPYTVTIIDTPGFGDTEGVEKDKQITQSITNLFKKKEYGVNVIHGIGFVAQSSMVRLTPTQKYIFDSILSMFGKDIAENIILLITFSDSQKPPLLASVKEAEIPYSAHFKFNNSALYVNSNAKDNDFDKMFWKMGLMSFEKFLCQLKAIEGKSLYLTKEVLKEREQLEVYIEGIQNDIRKGLMKLERYKVECDVVKQHEADIERNKDFSYTVDEVKTEKIDLDPGVYVTNCRTCSRTCHYPCSLANDANKIRCDAMNQKTGHCKICPGKCFWRFHHNVPYRFKQVTKQVTKTSDKLKNRYEIAKGQKMNADELAKGILKDFQNFQTKVLHMADKVRKSLERLGEIALRPNPLSMVQYLDILMESEKSEAKPGFQARINQLEKVKAQAIAMNEMAREGYDPFGKLR